jgi:hypothetical protein
LQSLSSQDSRSPWRRGDQRLPELEAGATPTDNEASLVQRLIAAIRAVTGLEGDDALPAAAERLNGWDGGLAVDGAEEAANAAAR